MLVSQQSVYGHVFQDVRPHDVDAVWHVRVVGVDAGRQVILCHAHFEPVRVDVCFIPDDVQTLTVIHSHEVMMKHCGAADVRLFTA